MSSPLLQSVAGADDYFRFGPVTRTDDTVDPPVTSPVDLTAAGTMVWFSARRAFSDTSPLVVKMYGVAAPDEPDGVTVNDPASSAKNMLTVAVAGEDTAALERTTNLVYDVWLREPDGRDSEIYRGEWQVQASVRGALA